MPALLFYTPRPLLSPAELRERASRLLRDARDSDLAARAKAACGRYRARWDRSRLRVDPDIARRLLAPIEVETMPGLAPERTTVFEKERCKHCLGIHSRHCPAVREIEFHPDGRVARVSYFGHWDDSAVLWREDLEEAAAWKDEAE